MTERKTSGKGPWSYHHSIWDAAAIRATVDEATCYTISYMPERKPHIPPWAEQERLGDMAWIGENLPEFWDAAQRGFEEFGRGAIAVDTTAQPEPDKGNPMYYLQQDLIPETPFCGEDEIRMVAAYDPSWQFVAILLKHQDRVSSYRVGMPGQQPASRGLHGR